MLVMTLNGYNKRSGGYHGTWFHPMQGGMKLQRGGDLQKRVYNDLGALKSLGSDSIGHQCKIGTGLLIRMCVEYHRIESYPTILLS